MAELKPCPFCGGKAGIYTQNGRFGTFTYIECETCSARSKTISTPYDYDDDRFWNSIYYNRVKEAWNRRYTPSEIDFDYGAED
jgi:hypothetical protein